MRTIAYALLGALLLGSALAKDSDWKAFRSAYEDTLKQLEDEKRPAARVQLLADLEGHIDKLCKVDGEKTVKFLLEVEVADLEPAIGRIVLKSLGKLSTVSEGEDKLNAERAIDELAKRAPKASTSSQSLLYPVLAKRPTPAALRALLKALKDKQPGVRRAAIRALGAAGPRLVDDAPGPLTGLLRRGTRREQWLAADAIEAITGTRPDDHPKPELDEKTALPSVWGVDRVLFVVEWSEQAAEDGFRTPFAEPEEGGDEGQGDDKDKGKGDDKGKGKGKGKGKDAEGEPAAAETFSALALSAAQVEAAIAKLPREVEFRVLRYSDRPRTFSDAYQRGGEKVAAEVRAWLTESPSRGPRDLGRAMDWVYDEAQEPDVVYVYTAGLPSGPRVTVDSTLEALERRAWGRDVTVHAVGLWPTPAEEPKSEVEKEERAQAEGNFRRLIHGLTAAGGGVFRVHTLMRPAEAGADDAEGKPAHSLGFPLDQPLSGAQTNELKRALKKASGDEALALWGGAAGCPDLQVARLAQEALEGDDLAAARAALDGFVRNKEPKVLVDLRTRAEKERAPRAQMRYVRALGGNPAPESAEALVELLPKLEGDVLRVAWRLLSLKPAGDLAAHADGITAAARGLDSGLTYRYAIQTVAKASGKPAPPSGGLEVGSKLLLPEHFAGEGVALLIDTYREVNDDFWTPPAKVEDAGEEGADEGKKPKRPKKPKKPKEPEAKEPEAVSRREAIRGEVGRALDALFTGEQRVYLRDLSGSNWTSESTALDKRPVLEDARAWVDALRVTTARDVAAAVRDALRDPAIEEVYVLVCGLPRRSPGAKVPDELAEDLALELDLRQVQVHVVLPLGTKQPDTAEYRDFLASLDAVYRPLADASGGSVSLRHAIEGVPAK